MHFGINHPGEAHKSQEDAIDFVVDGGIFLEPFEKLIAMFEWF